MTKFLELKHWQLFGLLVGLPLIFQLVAISSVITSQNPKMLLIGFPIMMIFFFVFFFVWLYAIGTSLNKKLPLTEKMNLRRFKIVLLIPFAYLILLSIFLFDITSSIRLFGQPNPEIFALIVQLHLFFIFCIFYCIYFNAKLLKTVECQKSVTFSDFAGEFFLFLFFPIGIWIIQPRLNKLFYLTVAPTKFI